MTKKITILVEITPAVEGFAKRHGAYFDKRLLSWVIEGEVPRELESFVQKTKRTRDYVVERVPQCPRCGSQMRLRPSTGGEFWGCSTYPRCKGTRSLEAEDDQFEEPEYEGLIYGTKAVDELADEPHSMSYSTPPIAAPLVDAGKSEVEDPAILRRGQAILDRAVKLFKDRQTAIGWLKSAKVSLGYKTPLDIMRTTDGCDLVEKLLEQCFEHIE